MEVPNEIIIVLLIVIVLVVGFLGGQFFKPCPECEQPNCLTATDLNTDHIATAAIVSRFCEGMGYQSNLLWQQDEEGNQYALPICTEGTQ